MAGTESLAGLLSQAIFFWNPSQPSGMIARDETGRYEGRFRGIDPNAFWVSKDGYKAGKFDGSNDIGEFQWRSAGNSAIPFVGQWGMTSSIWLYDDSFGSANLIGHHTGSSGAWRIYTDATNFGSCVGLTYAHSGYSNKWVHLACVGQGGVPGGANGPSWMYLNGVLVNSGTTYAPSSTTSQAQVLSLGAGSVALVTQANLFSGYLGEVVHWSQPLSQEQIAFIASLGPNGLNRAFHPRRRLAYADAATIGPMVGSSSLSITSAAGVVGVGGVVGSSALSLTPSAGVVGFGEVVGSSSLSLTSSAGVVGVGEAVGSSTLEIVSSAAIDSLGVVVGISSLSITAAGAVEAIGEIDGSSTLVIAAAGDLAAVIEIAGDSSLSIVSAGDIAAIGEASAVGSLSITAAGEIEAIGDVSAVGSLSITAAAVVVGLSEATGLASMEIAAAGDLSGVVDAAASASLAITAAGSLQALAVAAGLTTLSVFSRTAILVDGNLPPLRGGGGKIKQYVRI